MSTDLKLEIITTSSDESEALGKKIGASLKGGELIQLASDLGGGKTTLTRGIVAGAGSKDTVASPTFTISKLYKAPKFNIYHFDFYRLSEPGIIAFELNEASSDNGSVVIVEWADIVKNSLPKARIIINIEYNSDLERKMAIIIPKEYEYIYEAIK
jgi:tRNA threonylcarbamoyladenosine biosynthesis protein TsaE